MIFFSLKILVNVIVLECNVDFAQAGFNNLPKKLDNFFNFFSFIIPNIGFNGFSSCFLSIRISLVFIFNTS